MMCRLSNHCCSHERAGSYPLGSVIPPQTSFSLQTTSHLPVHTQTQTHMHLQTYVLKWRCSHVK